MTTQPIAVRSCMHRWCSSVWQRRLLNHDGVGPLLVAIPQSEEMRDVRLVDASQLPQPAHQRQVSSPDERQSRVYALYATDYDQVLLLGTLLWQLPNTRPLRAGSCDLFADPCRHAALSTTHASNVLLRRRL